MSDTKVLYDYQAFTMQTHGGVSRCFMELYKHLPEGVKAQIAIKESDNVYIRDIEGVKPAHDRYNKFVCPHNFWGKGHLHLWYDKLTHGGYYPNYNKTYSIELLRKGDFDVFHPTFFSDYFLPYLNGKPFVLTIHDMIPELYPQYFSRDDIQVVMKKKLAPLASAIIAVSENTKKDIIRILGIPDNKIHVIYHGCSFPHTSKREIQISNPYLLYVGDRNNYKNFDLFVQYVTPFLLSHAEMRVMCTGRSFNCKEKELFTKHQLEERFVHYWVSSDDEFFSLYHQALCFVYPSEYEGFGIPILEAYKAGCPVLLNNASCFPEIAGDAAVYFHMDSIDSDIVEKLEKIYSYSEKERNALLAKQQERLALYSWEQSANQMAKIYCDIASI